MTLKLVDTAIVDAAGGNDAIALASLTTLTAAGNPTYLVVNALDRDEYTTTATGETGSFAGNNQALGLRPVGGDGLGAGLVFTWQASSGQYVNATYGALGQFDFTDSSSPNDVTDLSFFGTSNLSLANQDAANAYGLMQQDAAGYLGSVTIATSSDFASPPPPAATPDGIAAAALAMVGQAWNENGCWVLASTIAAEAGAGLPVQSTALGVPGAANGEWCVVYNGPVSSSANWQSLVATGDVVAFETSSTTGHITTCVSGSGSTAMLLDNITYIGPGGAIQNSAHDGAASDVTISAPHLASQEFAGINPSGVVIYALDTPVITDKIATETLTTGASVVLSTLFTATDPAHKSITTYQVTNAAGSDTLEVGSKPAGAATNGTATVSSLASLSLLAGSTATVDTLEIRASNGSYWGDWQTLAVNVVVPPPKPPVLATPVAAQTWQQGSKVNLIVPAKMFKDPQGAALSYTASGVGGGSLPAWLSFAPGTNAFSGIVPAGMEKFSVAVTATDALGASASATFTVTVPAAPPVLALQESPVTLAESTAGSFALPAGSFTDPQGENLTYKASLTSGGALPSWLKFIASSQTFSATAPKTASSLQVKVTASDSSALSASETFSVAVAPAATSAFELADWSGAAAEPVQHSAAAAGALLGLFESQMRAEMLATMSHFLHGY